jgi:hypothetical protein
MPVVGPRVLGRGDKVGAAPAGISCGGRQFALCRAAAELSWKHLLLDCLWSGLVEVSADAC